MAKKKAPVLDTEYLYPPVAPGQEPILLQRLPLDERIDRAIAMNLDNLEYERARADAAVATLAAWRAEAIQQHIKTLGEFIDMVNIKEAAEKRARRAEDALAQLQARYDTIPFDDLRQIASESQLASWSSIRYLRDWLDSLDAA